MLRNIERKTYIKSLKFKRTVIKISKSDLEKPIK